MTPPNSSPKLHLRVRIPMQRSQKNLISNASVILHMKDLRQPELPRRIALQFHVRSENNQQIRLAHDALADFGVDEIEGDVGGGELVSLGHFGEGLGEVDERGAAVFGGEEEDGEVV